MHLRAQRAQTVDLPPLDMRVHFDEGETLLTEISAKFTRGQVQDELWAAGFVVYQWLYPTGPAWWVDLVARLHPPDWGIGATVPSFLVAFALAAAVCVVSRRSEERTAPA